METVLQTVKEALAGGTLPSRQRCLRPQRNWICAALKKAMQEIERANPDTLFRVFGSAAWGNKEEFSDELLSGWDQPRPAHHAIELHRCWRHDEFAMTRCQRIE